MLTDWIQTYTGQAFYPLEPEIEKIDIQDIAHALSMLCRFGGHSSAFYSVAEHSIGVSHAVPHEVALWGLLHDATEAYLIDLPRPIKNSFPEYKAAETRLMRVICERFSLGQTEPPEVKDADRRIISNEREILLGYCRVQWLNPPEKLPNVSIMGYPPHIAERLFLRRFEELYRAI